MNYGKYKFEQAKKEKEAKKKQKTVEVKEIRITPNIEEHDFGFKAKNARKFIEITDLIAAYIDNEENFDIKMWISLDKDIFIKISEYNANDIIKYLFERYPY